MKLFSKCKDGGPKSPVDAYFLIESKRLGSIVLLKFNRGAREEFHTHAFNAWTWFLCGDLTEQDVDGTFLRYTKKLLPKSTPREKFHRVVAKRDSWCFTIRGPWVKNWMEYNDQSKIRTTFSWGRKVIKQEYIQCQ